MLRLDLRRIGYIELKKYNKRYKQIMERLNERYKSRLSKSFRQEVSRKLIHLSSLWIPLFIYYFPTTVSVAFFSTILAIDGLLEYGNYKRWKWSRRTFGVMLHKTLRSKELTHKSFQPTGSVYVLSAAVLCAMMFPRPVAAIALTVMLTSDACAALFGKAFGTRKLYKKKSLEGTTAFFLCTLFVMMLYTPLYPVTYASIIAALVATFAEMYEDKIDIDDNLSVPLSIGIILTLLN